MRTELTLAELEEQDVELLPARAALGYHGYRKCCGSKWVNVYATNQALAMNVGSHFSNATANANQLISVG